ncbi:MAG: alpha-amylase family glycosyl hydrolase [Syntrophales bacterium]|nr:alpha-amylase family glycosyl hydrolase [Syntrophales bacterium]MCK9528429.1 alpha-amylase family glycosyl hydrolase [Syntrophales bacterium]MDX9922452.1 alpha-amylase family glycosyl hydrolase [Syntrophales bacterium]
MTTRWNGAPTDGMSRFYDSDPDFRRPVLDIPAEKGERIFKRLRFLYGTRRARRAMPELLRILKVHHAHKHEEWAEAEKAFDPAERFSERDMILITYGDMVRTEKRSPLAALGNFLMTLRRRAPVFNTIHILPFFPYSSDRGFSVIDYRIVDPALGSWMDIERIGTCFRLMFDGVFNHASSKSVPFKEMFSGNPDFQDFAVTFTSKEELTPEQRKLLRRPRTSDILTQFHSIDGPLWAWTTFSPDQIDLNYRNPKVLLRVIETLLLYVRQGADLIRLDAVTYLWWESGSSGANLKQTHQIIKLFRDVLDLVAPRVALVTETNVPYEENISYFGDGDDESQMVYNFSLPPLVLHAFYRRDASTLTRWAETIRYPSSTTTYLNILDTHDGVGLPGIQGILSDEEVEFLISRARQHGAFISYRGSGEADREPYEINSTWYSALNMDNVNEERLFQVRRFVASRSIALALKGVPGIYLHGLIGSRSDIQLALRTRSKRDVNRAMIDEALLERSLVDPGSKMYQINDHLGRLLEIRVRHRAFHPNGDQRILSLSPDVFALVRTSPGGGQHILAITSVTDRKSRLEIPCDQLGFADPQWYDLVAGRGLLVRDDTLVVDLQPYDVLWLTPFSEIEQRIESAGMVPDHSA